MNKICILPRPYVLTPVVELSDAILVVYRGGNGIGQATAECIFDDFVPSGKLPFQLPRSQSQVGTDNINDQIEKWELPYDIGATDAERLIIRSYIDQDLPVPPIFGDPLFRYGFGIQGFGTPDETAPEPFDLIAPEDYTATSSTSMTFSWEPASDPESSISYYEFYLDEVKRAEVTTTDYTLDLLEAGDHTWYVKAVNGAKSAQASTSVFNFTIIPTAVIPANESEGGLKIYPNPVVGRFTVDLSGSDYLNRLKIVDVSGKIIMKKPIDAEIMQIDLSGYPSGIYFLTVFGDTGIVVAKIIKN
ncbi:MAG: T9SS type A sorting domain-containing protein [Candidatus Azobacteroides sp.]|nr:T9SS type A sorting domain-containing protein [Candidatus Azobacteroides sp.]